MNERLKDLSYKAVLLSNEVFDYEGKEYSEIVQEKFAELIVKECVDMLREREEHMHTQSNNPISSIRSDECHIMADYIETHFGVEE